MRPLPAAVAGLLAVALDAAPGSTSAPAVPPTRVDLYGDPLPPGAIARIGTTRLGSAPRVSTLAFASDGNLIVTGSSDGRVTLWESATGRPSVTMEGHTHAVDSVSFSAEDGILASASGWSADPSVRLWKAPEGAALAPQEGEAPAVFAPDGQSLAARYRGTKIRVWELVDAPGLFRELRVMDTGAAAERPINGLAWSPDSKTIASVGSDLTIRLWDAATGRMARGMMEPGNPLCAAFSHDGTVLVTGSADRRLRFWEVGTGKEIETLEAHEGPIQRVQFTPDGKTLASGAEDKTIRLWDATTRREVRRIEGEPPFAFSPDGTRLAARHGGSTVLVWDLGAAPGAGRP